MFFSPLHNVICSHNCAIVSGEAHAVDDIVAVIAERSQGGVDCRPVSAAVGLWTQPVVILWPVIVHWSLTFSQTVIAWPVIVHLSLTFSQTVTAWPVSLLGTSVEDCCDKCSIVQCKLV